MTGMYNVREQLRRGEPLSPKERQIHEQGLVSILRQLHDELDTAVLAAYGWQDLTPALIGQASDGGSTAPVKEEILQRLVALNAERAAEERRGLVRWLRPDFQCPGGSGQVQAEAELATATSAPTGPKPNWPKTLPEQFQALRTALAASSGPQSAAGLAQGFTCVPRTRVAELLDTLAALGHARRLEDGRYLAG